MSGDSGELATRARALLAAGKPAEAMEAARRARAADPRNAEAATMLGFSLLALDRPEQAVPELRRALELHPGSLDARGGLALAYGALGVPQARKAFEDVLAAAPKDVRYLRQYAQYLWRVREADAANQQMERALQAVPASERPALLEEYGKLLYAEGRFVDAARRLRQARDLGVREPSLSVELGAAELENGRFAEAERALREAIAAAGEDASPRHLLGVLLILTGRAAEAVRELSQAVRLQPRFVPAWVELGRAAEAAGDLDSAETAYRRALQLEPELPRARYLLGSLLARRGRVEEAKREMARYAEAYEAEQRRVQSESARNAELNLAKVELAAGRADAALERFRRYPDDVEALNGAAEALSRLGRRAEAIAALERAVSLAPADRRLQFELSEERERSSSR